MRFQQFLDEEGEDLSGQPQLDQLEKAYKAGYEQGFGEGQTFCDAWDKD